MINDVKYKVWKKKAF